MRYSVVLGLLGRQLRPFEYLASTLQFSFSPAPLALSEPTRHEYERDRAVAAQLPSPPLPFVARHQVVLDARNHETRRRLLTGSAILPNNVPDLCKESQRDQIQSDVLV